MMTEIQLEPERSPPAWIFVPGLLAVSWSWFILTDDIKFKIAGLGSAALCLIGIIASQLHWKAARRVLAVTVLALYWATVGVVCFFTLLSPGFMLVYVGFLTIPAFLIVGLCTAYARRGLNRAWWLGSSVAGFSCGFIIVAVLSAPDLKRTADQANWTRPTEPIVLEEDMVKLVKCSREFARLHPESGYPESLHQMGPDGTGCLPEALLTGSYKGFSISYHPGARNAQGTIGNFTINAEQAAPHGPDFSTMSTDESGFVVYKYEGPHGKGIPSSYSSAESPIANLLGCMWHATDQNWSNVPQREQYFKKCLGDTYVFTSGSSGEVGAYTFAYSFEQDDSGTIDGFTGEVRPRTYGIGGIRSYLIVGKMRITKSPSGPANRTATLRVYATPEDRPATRSDPLANECEIEWVACIGPAQIN